MSKILCALHDPGGTLATLPVLRLLPPESLTVLVGHWAADRFKPGPVRLRPIPAFLTSQDATTIVETERPDLLLTATSWGGNAEQALRDAARRRNIPSVVVIDFWANYTLRFRESDMPVAESTDMICVMDTATRREMVAEGFAPEQIFVTGHPYLEALFRNPAAPNPKGRDAFLFLSQPALEDGRTALNDELLRKVILTARLEAEHRGRQVRVDFKPHPKESFPTEEHLAKLVGGTNVQVRILSREAHLLDLLPAYEAVAGGTTMGLFEARSRGLAASALCAGTVNHALETALLDADIRPVRSADPGRLFAPSSSEPPLGWHAGATSNVLRIIKEHTR